MAQKLNLETLYNKTLESVKYVHKKDGKLKKVLKSLDPCFRELVENFLSMSVFGIVHEMVRKIEEFQEFEKTYSDLMDFIGPVEVFKHYEEENMKVADKIRRNAYHSDYLLKISRKWSEDSTSNNNNKLKSYYQRLDEKTKLLDQNAKNLQINIIGKMKQHQNKLIKNELKTKSILENHRKKITNVVQKDTIQLCKANESALVKKLKKELNEKNEENRQLKEKLEQKNGEVEQQKQKIGEKEEKMQEEKKKIEGQNQKLKKFKKEVCEWNDYNMQPVANLRNFL